jgi:hypothetical protein
LINQCLTVKHHCTLVGGPPGTALPDDGWCFNITWDVVRCHENCLTCSGPTENDCMTAYQYAHLMGTAPYAVECDAGFYPSPTPAFCLCIICHATCGTCIGPLIDDCMSPLPNAELILGTAPSATQCQTGYFPMPDSSNCLATGCHSSCDTCNQSGAAYCLSCHAFAELAGLAPNFCVCNSGKYGAPDAGNCTPCHVSCATCTSSESNKCITCYTNAELIGASPNQCLCKAGHSAQPNASNCVQNFCHPTCKTCLGSNAADCNSCLINAVLAGNAPSICVCGAGFYPNVTVENCSACHPSCKICSGGDES